MNIDDVVYAVVLGIIQGVTEFLPVSSSAHLIIASWLFKGKSLSLSLNIALHMGTLSAVLVYFKKDFISILKSLAALSKNHRNPEIMLAKGLVVGTIPAAVVGLAFKDEIEAYFHNPQAVIYPLAIVGVLLWLIDHKSHQSRNIVDLKISDAFLVGVAQMFALIPGTSRSGATIVGARILGFDRESAARFSFLLGTPAMLGAAVLEGESLIASLSDPVFYVGFLVSALVGILTIHFLLQFVKRFGFLVFALYRVVVAIFLFFLV